MLVDGLQRTARHLGDAIAVGGDLEIRGAGGRHRPQVEQAPCPDDRRGVQARLAIGHEGDRRLVQALQEPLVAGEHERPAGLDRAAQRAAELIPLKRRRRGPLVEVVRRVEGAVADELEGRPAPPVRARLRHDGDLAARLLAVFGAVGVAQDVELANASMPRSCPLAPPGVMLFSAAPVNSTPFNRNRFCCGRSPTPRTCRPSWNWRCRSRPSSPK